MKKNNILLSAFVLLLVTVSCDHILEENIVSGITSDAHYTNAEGFEDAVRAAYSRLRIYTHEEHLEMQEYGTDIFSFTGHSSDTYFDTYGGGLNATAGNLGPLWDGHYQFINVTNAVIGRAPETEMPEDRKAIRVAEARFLRAFYYFDLIQHFDRIHLTLEETEGVETTANIVDAGAVYTAMIEDLNAAIPDLPVHQDEYGRATKPAAEMLLGHVLLTRGQSDFSQANDLANAIDLFDAVIDYPHLNLLDDYTRLWSNGALNHNGTELAMGTDLSIRKNEEVVFSVQFSDDPLHDGPNNNHMYYRPNYEQANANVGRIHEPGYGRPWVHYRPTQWAMDNFRYKNEDLDNDARFDPMFQRTWYITDGDNPTDDVGILIADEPLTPADITELEALHPDAVIMTWRSDNMVAKGGPFTGGEVHHFSTRLNMFPMTKKHDDWTRPSVNHGNGQLNHYIYRLARAYLFAAEAYVAMGNPAGAVSYINAVRERAAFPGKEAEMRITAADVDMDFILDEMAREFYGESFRWTDLKRTGKLIERNQNLAQTATGNGGYGGEFAPNIQPHHIRRPIPQRAIDETIDTVIEQNPGY